MDRSGHRSDRSKWAGDRSDRAGDRSNRAWDRSDRAHFIQNQGSSFITKFVFVWELITSSPKSKHQLLKIATAKKSWATDWAWLHFKEDQYNNNIT